MKTFRNFYRKSIVSLQISFYTAPSNKDVQSGEWYPKHVTDLDYICDKVILCDHDAVSEMAMKHPSFKDDEYRKRREWFLKVGNDYKHGTPIPRIVYTAAETKTWGIIYRDLKSLHNKFACKQFLNNFKLLEDECGYSDKQIPQLEDISKYLKTKTNFTLRPCGGYLTSRSFLAALAFRVFCCTQYMRHPADPHYTPEPDLCHELIGHMAMFLDPIYAQLSQEIGIASLGCSEEVCNALIRLYFFTFEFGLLDEGESVDAKERKMKVYGAGLLSCFDELKHSMSSDAKIYRLQPEEVIKVEPEITQYQKCYFYSRTMNDAFDTIKSFISKIKRPFSLEYDPITQSMKTITNDVAEMKLQ